MPYKRLTRYLLRAESFDACRGNGYEFSPLIGWLVTLVGYWLLVVADDNPAINTTTQQKFPLGHWQGNEKHPTLLS